MGGVTFWGNGEPLDGLTDGFATGGNQFWVNGGVADYLPQATPPVVLSTWRPDPVFLGTAIS